jgi:hypothetical protein
MQRVFLHIVEGSETLLDPEGSEVTDIELARQEAIEGARLLMMDALRSGERLRKDRVFKVTDERGLVLLTIPFVEALHPADRG